MARYRDAVMLRLSQAKADIDAGLAIDLVRWKYPEFVIREHSSSQWKIVYKYNSGIQELVWKEKRNDSLDC